MVKKEFKKGISLMLGGIAALALVAVVYIVGSFIYSYVTTNQKRTELVALVVQHCGNGKGDFRPPTNQKNDASSIFANMDNIKAQQVLMRKCVEAQVNLMAFDLENTES